MKADTPDRGRLHRRCAWVLAAVLMLPLAAAQAATGSQAISTHEISREQATQALQKRYGSAVRVVRSDVIEQGGHHVYVFRLLSANGQVWVVRVDAQSGAEVP
jgi:uncharacterized membrane protein YkoI